MIACALVYGTILNSSPTSLGAAMTCVETSVKDTEANQVKILDIANNNKPGDWGDIYNMDVFYTSISELETMNDDSSKQIVRSIKNDKYYFYILPQE